MKTYPDNTRNITFSVFDTTYPVFHKPVPTRNDYENGYITRYFVKKINDSVIYEISSDNYSDISDNFFARISIQWRIAGKKRDVYENKIKTNEGVFEYNRSQILFYEKIIPGLSRVLRDPLEYWQPS